MFAQQILSYQVSIKLNGSVTGCSLFARLLSLCLRVCMRLSTFLSLSLSECVFVSVCLQSSVAVDVM